MAIQYWALIACLIAVLFSVVLATIALLRCYFPPQTRAVMQLRDQVGEVQDDNDRIHARLNDRAARENMAKARERKTSKADLAAEAQEVLRERIQPGGGGEGAGPDVEAQRAAYRRRFLQH